MKSKAKIKKLYKSKFDTELSDERLELLIKHECKCDNCEKSIFELDNFPEMIEKHDLVMCESCYADSGHRANCQICGSSFDTIQEKEWFWYENKEEAEYKKRKPGIYKIDWFDCDGFPQIESYEPALVNMDVADFDRSYKDTWSGWICPDCAEKYSKKDNYLTLEDAPCILFEEHRKQYFSDYTDERLHKAIQRIVHERITNRGIIERANRGKK